MRTDIVICLILLGFTHASGLAARDCTEEGYNSETSEGTEYGSSGRCGFIRRTRGIFDGIREVFSGILDKVRSGFRSLKKAGSNLIGRLLGKHEKSSNTISDDNKSGDFNFKHTPVTEKGGYSLSDDGNYENGAGSCSGFGEGSDSNDNIDNAGSKGHEVSDSEGYGVTGSGNKGLSVDLSITGSGNGLDGHGISIHTKGSSKGENSNSTIEVNGSVGHVNSSDGSYSIKVFDEIREIFSTVLGKDHSTAGKSLINESEAENATSIYMKSQFSQAGTFAFNGSINNIKNSGGKYDDSLENNNPEGDRGSKRGNYGGSESADISSERSEGYGVTGSGNKRLSVDLSFTGSGNGRDGHGISIHTKGSSNGENSRSTIEVNGSVGHVNSSDGSYSIEVFDEIRNIFSTVLGKDLSTTGESLITDSETENATSIDIRSQFSQAGTFAFNGTINSIKNSGGKYDGNLENNNRGGDRGSDRGNYGGSESADINSEHRDRGQTVGQEHRTINESRISVSSGEYNKSDSRKFNSGGDFLASGGYGLGGYMSSLGGGLRRISGDGGSGLNSEFTFGDEFGTTGSVGSEFSSSSSDSSLRGSGIVYWDSSVSNPYGSSTGGDQGESSVGSSNFGCKCRNRGGSGLKGYAQSGSAPVGWGNGGFKGSSDGNLGGGFGISIGNKGLPPLPISMYTGAFDLTGGYRTIPVSFNEHKDLDNSGITGLVGNPISSSDASSHVSWYRAIGEQRYSEGVGAVGGFNSHKSSIGAEHGVRPNEANGLLVEQGNGGIGSNSYQYSRQGSASEDSNARRNGDGYIEGISSQDSYGESKDVYGGGSYVGSGCGYGEGVSSRNSYGDSNNGDGGDLSTKGSGGSGSGFGCAGVREKSQTVSTSTNIDYRGSVGGNIEGIFNGGSSRDSGSNGQNGGGNIRGLNSYSGYIGFGGRLAAGLSGGTGGTRGYGSASSYSTHAVSNGGAYPAGFGGFNGFGDSVAATQAPLYSLNYWPQLAQPVYGPNR